MKLPVGNLLNVTVMLYLVYLKYLLSQNVNTAKSREIINIVFMMMVNLIMMPGKAFLLPENQVC